ncbi:hypothetical protein AKJ09_09484 [Labilithrix luteola]|uniref:Uncharacterized protein n=1 Tax=Labilithrix luteola TaxID=1391654 RepID=A0A0K1QAK6_9BACT|nr:hypothetical protein AKJ09_09484 [Labilithrix luteola]
MAVVSLLVACSHNERSSGITTLSSGTPNGVRVTETGPALAEPAARLAQELCSREAECDRIGKDGSLYASEDACRANLDGPVRTEMASWRCTPASKDLRFEDCLASIRSAHCETSIDHLSRLTACQSLTLCPP